MEPIALCKTISIITKCWREAENQLRSLIKRKYHDLDEPVVTILLCREFAFRLRTASEENDIRSAFFADLRAALPETPESHITFVASNIIAEVIPHNSQKEKISGGDFGLVVTRPHISFERDDGSCVIDFTPRQGILGQAKMLQRSGKWGTFSKRQCRVLPGHLSLLGLVLYAYETTGERNLLKPIRWKLCNTARTMNEVKRFLKTEDGPDAIGTDAIIQRLVKGEIGTDDELKLEKIMFATARPLYVKIGPRNGDRQVTLQVRSEHQHLIERVVLT